jgi:hypothetical protein
MKKEVHGAINSLGGSLTLTCPKDAAIWIGPSKTTMTGSTRSYQWHDPVTETIKVTCKWEDQDGPHTQIVEAYLSPGCAIAVGFGPPHVEDETPAMVEVSVLSEVNAVRAQRGLPPYLEDPLLTAGAQAAANFRATYQLAGHTSNDFAFLPPGASAPAAGCATWEPSWGWGSCCTFENHTYAGAAYAMGNDGLRYMHLFVR